MDSLITALILIALAFPFAAIVALVKISRTRQHLRLLDARLAAVERRVAEGGAAVPASTVQPVMPPVTVAPSAPAAPAAAPVPSAPMVSEPVAAAPAAEPVAPAEPAPPADAVPPAAPAVTPPAAPPPPRKSFEERFGTRWVVWVGGLALALGGIFLVQYSIEQGLIGPGVRVMLGGILAAALVVAGEWTRRREVLSGFAGLPTAHIPSILTAAGTTIAYATVFAAYAAYGFLDAGAAFILLGLVALATLAAALLHGAALAALGVVGAFVTPILVASDQPNYWALTIYLGVVTAAALALARARLWRWLAVTAVVFGVLWMFIGIDDVSVESLAPHVLHGVIGFVLVAVFIVSGFLFGPEATPGRIERISSGALAAWLFAAAVLVVVRQHDGLSLFAFAAMIAATVWIAWRTEAAVGAVPAGALLVALVLADWALAGPVASAVAAGGPGAASPVPPDLAANRTHLAVGAAFAALFGWSGYVAQDRSTRALPPILWAASAVFAPVAILVALYYRLAHFERSLPFAAAALVLAALYAAASDRLSRSAPRPGMPSAAAIFATGAVAGLALTLTFALDKGWLSVGFALMVPGVAWIASQRPLPALRWLAGALVILVVGRVAYEQGIAATDLGKTPVFNWILYSYGVPAVSFWTAGFILRRRADDVPARMTDSAAILFTVLLFFLEIRHYMNGGNIYAVESGLAEVALQVSVGLALAIGLERLRERSGSIVHNIGALVVAGLTLIGAVFRLGVLVNPWFEATDVGGPFFNLILLGYLLPAVLFAILGLMTRATRPQWYRTVAAVTAVGLTLLYLTLEVTRLYHGPVFAYPEVSDAEQYTYSAVWLAFGVLLLVAGIFLRSQPVRLASAAVIVITVAKVFLVDMSGLTGVYRALSFIGLGLVLVGIGYLYQRLLFPPRRTTGLAP